MKSVIQEAVRFDLESREIVESIARMRKVSVNEAANPVATLESWGWYCEIVIPEVVRRVRVRERDILAR